MKQNIHRIAAIIATLCIATFFTATLLVELFGSKESIALVKSLIVMPGLYILVPTMAITGATGFALAKARKGKIIENKKKRMPIIGATGILVLLPAAIVLNQWAAVGIFDAKFYILQVIELIAGASNLRLMLLSIKDGMKLAGRKSTKTL